MNAVVRQVFRVLVALSAPLVANSFGQRWALDPAVTPVLVREEAALSTSTLLPLPSGLILAYGDFSHSNGAPAEGIVRWEASGRRDPLFQSDLAGEVQILTAAPLADGRLVVVPRTRSRVTVIVDPAINVRPVFPEGAATGTTGGESPSGGGVGAAAAVSIQVIRLGTDGRRDTSFAPVLFDTEPRLTALTDGRILAWGSFRLTGGARRNGLARLNADGTLDAGFTPVLASGLFYAGAVAAAPDGAFYVSGYTISGNRGETVSYVLAKVLASGAADTTFAPKAITANFRALATAADGGVFAVNPSVGYIAPGEPVDLAGGAPSAGLVVASSAGLSRFLPNGGLDAAYRPQIPGVLSITAIAPLPGGRLAVGAQVGGSGAIGTPVVCTLTPGGQVERDLRRVAGGGEGQRLLAALPDGRVIFERGKLLLASSIYALPMDSAAPAAASAIMPVLFGPTLVDTEVAVLSGEAAAAFPVSLLRRTPGSVSQLETDGAGRIVATGAFTHVDGEPRPGLARFLPSGALDRGFVPPAGELLLVPADGRLILRQTTVGPLERDGFHRPVVKIIRLREGGDSDPGFVAPDLFDATRTSWLQGTADGRLLVAAFDPDDSREQNLKLIWLASDGRRLVTLPTVFSGFSRYFVMPLDAAGAPAVPELVIGLPYPYGRPNIIDAAVPLPGGQMLVTGGFSQVNGAPRPGLVRLLADGKEDAGYVPPVDATTVVSTVLPLPDGRALMFASSRNGGRWQPLVQRLGLDGRIDASFLPPPEALTSGLRVLADGSLFGNGRRFLADGWPDLNFVPQFRLPGGGNGWVATAVLGPDGRLWVGGNFSGVDGEARSSLARFLTIESNTITTSPRSQTVVAGRDAYFQAAVGTAQPATYRWFHDGLPLAGETRPGLRLTAVVPAQAGSYQAVVSVGGRNLTSESAILTVTPNSTRLVNFSARSRVVAGGTPQVAGLVATAPSPRAVLFRAVGNGLPGNAGTAMLPSPLLALYDGERLVGQDRGGALAAPIVTVARTVCAFPLSTPALPAGAVYGSALVTTLGPGTYTALTSSADAGSGLSLFEFYDTGSEAQPPLVRNISLRGQTAPGVFVLTAGFVLAGNGPVRVLIRGLGPALIPFGVTDAVSDPKLALFTPGFSTPMAENDDWGGTPTLSEAARRSGAFALPAASRDAALVTMLEPGAYSVQLSAAGAATGTGLVEIYVLGPE